MSAPRSLRRNGGAEPRALAGALSLGLVLLAGSGPARSAPARERSLSLDEAILMALERSEGIIVERESLESARDAETGSRGAYDPLLELSGGWRSATLPVNSAFSGAPAGESAPTVESSEAGASVTQLLPTGASMTVSLSAARQTTNGSFDLLSPSYWTQAGVELRQPLLRDRATDPARSAIRIAAADRRRAEASLRREVSDTLAAVERAYWTLVAAQREVAVRDEAVRLAAEQLEETRVRVEKGAVPETEIAQPRAELERRRGESFAAREAAARSRNALKLLILGDGETEAWSYEFLPVDDPAMPITPVDVSVVIERALASRPELEEAEAIRERRRLESALARDAVRPALDAVASYDRFGLAGDRNPDRTLLDPNTPVPVPAGMEGAWRRSFGMLDEDRFEDARIGLEFSLPLGNRAARTGAAVARNSEQQADADLTRARKAVRAEVLDAAAALETTGQRIEAARAAREAAEIQLAAERDRYGAGLSTNFLVLTRQNDLSRARLDEIAALTDYRKASAEMARAAGTMLSDRGIEIDSVAHVGDDPS